jgi:hypothetical protein
MFEEFYQSHTSGRKLTWIFTRGDAILEATYDEKRIYKIGLTTLQAIILLLFNSSSSSPEPVILSFEELQRMSGGLSGQICEQVLHSFVDGKLLRKENGNGNGISSSDLFSCNATFR